MLVGTLVIVCGAGVGSRTLGQNVVAYSAMRDPYLLLLREPAVHAELRLIGSQFQTLQKMNDRLDTVLFALRNWPPAKRQKEIDQLTAEAERRVATLLDSRQRRRLREIVLRVRGIRSLLDKRVAERLRINSEQTLRIEELIQQTGEKLKQLHKRVVAGESQAELGKDAERIRHQEQTKIVAVLNAEQQRKLRALVGRSFALSKLGQTRFKSPKLGGDANIWIQSEQVRIADLRGKVTVLHFWTYG